MTEIISSVICERVDDLGHGRFNYTGVVNVFHGLGPDYFELALNYRTDDLEINERVTVLSPTGKVLVEAHEQFDPGSYYFTSIHEMDIDFEEAGTYTIGILVNGLKRSIPFEVIIPN